jgi:hypothetical protein
MHLCSSGVTEDRREVCCLGWNFGDLSNRFTNFPKIVLKFDETRSGQR